MIPSVTEHILFSPGPVNLHPAIKENLFNVELCHREPDFDALYARVAKRLFEVAALSPRDFKLSLLHGSGATAVDAGLSSLVRGRVLVIANGLYCDRIEATLAMLEGAEPIRFDAGLGRPPDLGELEAAVERHAPDWIAAVHHETTTGLLNPLGKIAALARSHGCRLFVDAVSSLAGHELDFRPDVLCFNSNKCLESLPGIAGVFWARELEPQATLAVLDVAAHADAIPFTPNVQAFVALDIALDLLAEEDRPARYARVARAVWEHGSRGFEPLLPEPVRSHVLTTFRLGDREAGEIFGRGLERGYVLYPGHGPLRGKVFRVANLGHAIDEQVVAELFELLNR